MREKSFCNNIYQYFQKLRKLRKMLKTELTKK